MTASADIGFIGTGTITQAMVEGLLSPSPAVPGVLVSPRNADIAARLAATFPAVRIAASNQQIVDSCKTVVLAVRPQVAEEVIRPLRFRDGQTVISVIAATDREKLLPWIGAEVVLSQAVPLPFVAHRAGVTAIYPPDATAASLFSTLGTAVECETRREYDVLAAVSALMATYFGMMHRAVEWAGEQGVSADKGRAYLAPLFSELAHTALRETGKPLDALSREFSTKGGLNEQVLTDFDTRGGTEAIRKALDRVLQRIEGR